jgi:hypothetical protein
VGGSIPVAVALDDLRRVRALAKRRKQVGREFRRAILAAYRDGDSLQTIATYAGLSKAWIAELVKKAQDEENNP